MLEYWFKKSRQHILPALHLKLTSWPDLPERGRIKGTFEVLEIKIKDLLDFFSLWLMKSFNNKQCYKIMQENLIRSRYLIDVLGASYVYEV